jgi:methylated-DNA-[protein]-cysteine S-methyltransferase
MTTLYATTYDSPVGPLLLVGDGSCLRGLYLAEHVRPPRLEPDPSPDAGSLKPVVEQLDEFFAGERRTFDVALDLRGTDFQRRVWAALLDIPYGETASYGEIAASIGRPTASRAVGAANGRNPVSIIVPCHRVIGASGALTGYAGGLTTKQALLAHERQVCAGAA